MCADITEGKPGAPVELTLQVVTADCAPIAGARLDLWQCDAHGAYSGVRGPQSGAAAGTVGETFLRGTQISDAEGVVRFRTIYPGWYEGRTAHFHFKVLLDGGWTLTSQIFLPDALSQFLYDTSPPYSQRVRRRRTFNRNDGIAHAAGDGANAAVREQADRYVASLVVGIDPAREPGGTPPRRHAAANRGRQGPSRSFRESTSRDRGGH